VRVKEVRPVTAGERLYLLVRDEILDLMGEGVVRWKNIAVLFEDLTGSGTFSAYIKGAAAIHATRRLLRFWHDERPSVLNESQYVRRVSSFVRQEMFPSVGDEPARKIARAVIEAEQACNRSINSSCRAAVLKESRRQTCYLCGKALDPKALKGTVDFLTLEHVWPTSMGGDSVEDNLLPACTRCQHHTQDALSWEWPNIHNLVLPSNPSEQALNSVPRKVRYARHYLEALRISTREHLSLKQAFLRLGPASAQLGYVATGLPLTFFDLQTTTT
jgi:hypothetical protein